MSVETVPIANASGQGHSTKRVSLIFGVLSLAIFMSSLDLFIVNRAISYIGRDFHGSSLSSMSWVLNGYAIMFAAVLAPVGRWTDRIGHRKMFTAGLVVFTPGSVLRGVAPGAAALIAARVAQAIGAGMMVPASLSLLLAAVPGLSRAPAIGTWSAFGALGGALGPVTGGLLVEVSWRWVFWINIRWHRRRYSGAQDPAREQGRVGCRPPGHARRPARRAHRRLVSARAGEGSDVGLGVEGLHGSAGALAHIRVWRRTALGPVRDTGC